MFRQLWTANEEQGITSEGGEEAMGSLSIWHCVVAIVMIAKSDHGVKKGAAVHAVVSALVSVYGLVYFFAAAKS